MLDALRRIVQEVNSARCLQEALDIIVQRVKAAIDVDACSIYLLDKSSQRFVLMATDGMNPQLIGVLRIPQGSGLVSLVAEREEPLNLENAQDHPKYLPLPSFKSTEFFAFLGAPIIHHRDVMGVIVIRQRVKHKFSDNDEAFLMTAAAQLAGGIAHAETSGEVESLLTSHLGGERAIAGVAGAPGVVLGTAMVVYPSADLEAVPDREVADPEAEVQVFLTAVERAKEEIRRFIERGDGVMPKEEQAIFEAYLLMLKSDSIVGRTIERIRLGSWASGALRETINERAKVFDEMEDTYLRDRANDVRDLGRRVLMCLQSGKRKRPPYPKRTILVGEEITATMLADVPRNKLVGVVSMRGSISSHVSIVANALGIPAVVGVGDLPIAKIDMIEMIVDGYRGQVYVSPSAQVKKEYKRLQKEEEALSAGLELLRDLPAETTDGVRIPLYANTGLFADVSTSLSGGAEGIGLYRSEFPFMIRERFPSEDEQVRIYKDILKLYAGKPVTLRTLDIGGDKCLPYFPISEDNPFLGWRGIRVTLDHPEIFLAQVRAMLRASAGLDNLRIVLPMVATVTELDEALRLCHRAYEEVSADDATIAKPKLGVMLEVPSVIFMLDVIAPKVDFFSVGTNDLTQYLLAVDRNNARVAGLYDSLDPAVIKALAQILKTTRKHKKSVCVCGEMAGDPLAALVLVGLGVDCLSMNLSSLPKVKRVIRQFTHVEATKIAKKAAKMTTAKRVRCYLESILDSEGVGALVRAGGCPI